MAHKCIKCEGKTYVRDTAHSGNEFVSGRGHEYLERWGHAKREALGVGKDLPLTVRLFECGDCGTRYRSIEYILETYPPRKNTTKYGRHGTKRES